MQILPLLTLQGGISTFLFWQLELMFIKKLLIWRDNRILDSFVREYIYEREEDDEFGICSFSFSMYYSRPFLLNSQSFSLKTNVLTYVLCVVLGKTS